MADTKLILHNQRHDLRERAELVNLIDKFDFTCIMMKNPNPDIEETLIHWIPNDAIVDGLVLEGLVVEGTCIKCSAEHQKLIQFVGLYKAIPALWAHDGSDFAIPGSKLLNVNSDNGTGGPDPAKWAELSNTGSTPANNYQPKEDN